MILFTTKVVILYHYSLFYRITEGVYLTFWGRPESRLSEVPELLRQSLDLLLAVVQLRQRETQTMESRSELITPQFCVWRDWDTLIFLSLSFARVNVWAGRHEIYTETLKGIVTESVRHAWTHCYVHASGFVIWSSALLSVKEGTISLAEERWRHAWNSPRPASFFFLFLCKWYKLFIFKSTYVAISQPLVVAVRWIYMWF